MASGLVLAPPRGTRGIPGPFQRAEVTVGCAIGNRALRREGKDTYACAAVQD
jgi:hypothetical protein